MSSKKLDWIFLVGFLLLVGLLFIGTLPTKTTKQVIRKAPEPVISEPVFIEKTDCDCGGNHP